MSASNDDFTTQSIEDCEDYLCEKCSRVYTGDDWRERGSMLICPECDEEVTE